MALKEGEMYLVYSVNICRLEAIISSLHLLLVLLSDQVYLYSTPFAPYFHSRCDIFTDTHRTKVQRRLKVQLHWMCNRNETTLLLEHAKYVYRFENDKGI